MKNAVVLLLILLLSFAAIAQKKPAVRKRPAPVVAKATLPEPPKPLDEKEEYDKASNFEIAADRVAALKTFLSAFPNSEKAAEAKELIISSRVDR